MKTGVAHLKPPRFALREVRAFLCLADELHFGKAAGRLFTSQPALSRTIRALEEAVGVVLLERSTRKVRLTAAGEAFLADAQQAFLHLVQGASHARLAAEGNFGRLRIGYMDFAINGSLPELVKAFRSAHPNHILDLEYGPSARQCSALLEGSLDVGMIVGEFHSPGVSNILLEEHDYVALLPDGHRLARSGALRLTDLAEEPFVMGTEESFISFRRLFLPLCHAAGFSPSIVQQASSTTGIFGMVAAGVGVSVYAGCARNIQRLGVAVKPLTDVKSSLPTFAAWSNDNPSAALGRFRDFLGRHARLGQRRHVGRPRD
jgi:DNA-binding transcriptional LysR family regulator